MTAMLNAAPPTYRITRAVFIRLLGLIYLIAFLSLWVQITGLIGGRGILPVRDFLRIVWQAGLNGQIDHPIQQLPTLLWLNSSDWMLHLLCGIGVVGSLCIIGGLAQWPALFVNWLCYLSLAVGGQAFLSFQWDSLLLEAGFVAIFLAPIQFSPRPSKWGEPSRIALWLVWWILFRLMFLSGIVKLTWGDPAWLTGRAMDYHYLSQPLPTWTSWYVYQFPNWMQRVSVYAMFFIEIAVPFLIFAGTLLRRFAAIPLIGLQVLITITGNYGFFNLLTIVLCLSLLDDAIWLALGSGFRRIAFRIRRTRSVELAPQKAGDSAEKVLLHYSTGREESPAARRWPIWVIGPVATFIWFVTCIEGISGISPAATQITWPGPIASVRQLTAPFRSANAYGLFRVMTPTRQEIEIEWSDDAMNWHRYDYRWKPGDLSRRPAFCTPHMPRLDWQSWTPFLGNFGQAPWLIVFSQRLLENEPAVTSLLDPSSLPDHRPKMVRFTLYQYRFTTPQERDRTGDWWVRYNSGQYTPIMTLDPATGRLAVVR